MRKTCAAASKSDILLLLPATEMWSSVGTCDERPPPDRKRVSKTLAPKGDGHEELECLRRMHVRICRCVRCCANRQSVNLRESFTKGCVLHRLQRRDHASKREPPDFRLARECAYRS